MTITPTTESRTKKSPSLFLIALLVIGGLAVLGVAFAFAYDAIRGDEPVSTSSYTRDEIRTATDRSERVVAETAFKMAWDELGHSEKMDICVLYEESPITVSTLFIEGAREKGSEYVELISHEFIYDFFAGEC